MSQHADPNRPVFKHADDDGKFRRAASQFRSWISPDPSAEFPTEKGRYVLTLILAHSIRKLVILIQDLIIILL